MDISLFTSFGGRISRSEWWIGVAILIAASWIFMLVAAALFPVPFIFAYDPVEMQRVAAALALRSLIISLLLLYPLLALYAKRWHDRDKSGWWTLIFFVPAVGWIWILVELGCLPRTHGPNRYGPDPLREYVPPEFRARFR